MIDDEIYQKLKEEAKELGVPLASYAKMKMGEGRIYGRRKKDE